MSTTQTIPAKTQPFMPMIFARLTRPEYEDSFGEPLESLQGRSRWQLAGHAHRVWAGGVNSIGLLSRIQQGLQHQLAKVYGELSKRPDIHFHSYMIGYDERHAHPTVVVINPEADVLKNTRKIILADLKNVHFKMAAIQGSLNLLGLNPQLCHVYPHAMRTGSTKPSKIGGINFFVDGSRNGTIGGLLTLKDHDGALYGLTAAHIFNSDSAEPTELAPIHFYDSDDDDEEAEDLQGDFMIRDNFNASVLMKDVLPLSAGSSSNSDASNSKDENSEEKPLISASLEAAANTTSSENLDWALLNLKSLPDFMWNCVKLQPNSGIEIVTNLALEPPKGRLLVISRRGTLDALGSISTTAVVSSEILQSARWILQLKNNHFEPGDSGSWVIDATTGSLYGMLVAGCAPLGTGYLVPMFEIFEDITNSARLDGVQLSKPELPSTEDLLYAAAAHKMIDFASQLLQKLDPRHFPRILVAAAGKGVETLVSILLNKGVDVNAVDGDHSNALCAAASGGHEALVTLLLKEGAGRHSGDLASALYAASNNGHEAVVRTLFQAEAAGHAPRRLLHGNALYLAALRGHEGLVTMLLETNPTPRQKSLAKALRAASHGGHEFVVKKLIDSGADVNGQGGSYGNALQAASHQGHTMTVITLLTHGADVNAQGGRYGTALQAASYRGHRKIVSELLAHGADINVAQIGVCGTALEAASYAGHNEIVKLLVEHGADIDLRGGSLGNALLAALVEEIEEVQVQQGAQERLMAYWPLIQGMLIHGMPQMPLMQIGMILRMVVNGGFPYEDRELGEFLKRYIEEGILEVGAGGVYRLKK